MQSKNAAWKNRRCVLSMAGTSRVIAPRRWGRSMPDYPTARHVARRLGLVAALGLWVFLSAAPAAHALGVSGARSPPAVTPAVAASSPLPASLAAPLSRPPSP